MDAIGFFIGLGKLMAARHPNIPSINAADEAVPSSKLHSNQRDLLGDNRCWCFVGLTVIAVTYDYGGADEKEEPGRN